MRDTIYREDATEAVRKIVPVETEIDATLLDKAEVIVELSALPSAEAEQVTGKLDSPCGSSVTGDSEERKEQKSKLESADATCATCADRALCIMSDDGNLKACKDYRPSAEAEPTVIRSRTFMPTKDFKEWAKRIRETNPNAVVIPCDAEVVSADAVQGWIPCSERLPKINQEVLLSTADGKVFVGHREKPDLVWQVTETDGRKHWVYDPEAYTDDVDGLPKAEDCGFDKDSPYSDGLLSVTSVNYDNRFDGVTAWMPLPKPYTKGDNDEER